MSVDEELDGGDAGWAKVEAGMRKSRSRLTKQENIADDDELEEDIFCRIWLGLVRGLYSYTR